MRTHQNSRQGTAGHHEVHDTSERAHAARGPTSPLSNPTINPKESTIRRDEDFASAQMDALPKGTIPTPNQRGGVTAMKGKHGPQINEDVT